MEEEGSDEQDSGEGRTVSGSTDGQDWFNPTAKILLSCSPLFMLPTNLHGAAQTGRAPLMCFERVRGKQTA